MRKSDVIAYYGGNQSEAGRAIGVKRQSVNAWDEIIPELQARRYHEVTRGRRRNGIVLRFDPALYGHRQAS
jgi:hypothetical protein